MNTNLKLLAPELGQEGSATTKILIFVYRGMVVNVSIHILTAAYFVRRPILYPARLGHMIGTCRGPTRPSNRAKYKITDLPVT